MDFNPDDYEDLDWIWEDENENEDDEMENISETQGMKLFK